jgi:hypothetical protein
VRERRDIPHFAAEQIEVVITYGEFFLCHLINCLTYNAIPKPMGSCRI